MSEDSREAAGVRPLERTPTGVAGLDAVLCGGLVNGGTYLVMGRPGTGKTTPVSYTHLTLPTIYSV